MKKLLESILDSEAFYLIVLVILVFAAFLPRTFNRIQEANLKIKETSVEAESLERAIQEETGASKDK